MTIMDSDIGTGERTDIPKGEATHLAAKTITTATWTLGSVPMTAPARTAISVN